MPFVHFTIAYWCVFVVALLPIVCAGIAKSGMMRQPPSEGGYDNENPRAWLARQSEWRARANAAQANSFEAMPFFMAAVIIAHQLGAPQGRLDILAFLFVVLRVVYIMAYVSGMGSMRTKVWLSGFLVNIIIFFIGYH